MPREEVHFPDGPGQGSAVGKRPALSAEVICEIGELSEIYLDSETVEFSEEDLLSNLHALCRLSMQQSARMGKAHARKVRSLAASVFSGKRLIGSGTQGPAEESSRQRSFHSKGMGLMGPENKDEVGRIRQYARYRAFEKLLRKGGLLDDGKLGRVLELYGRIPGQSKYRIMAAAGLYEFLHYNFNYWLGRGKFGSMTLEEINKADNYRQIASDRYEEFRLLEHGAPGGGVIHAKRMDEEMGYKIFNLIELEIKGAALNRLTTARAARNMQDYYPYLKKCPLHGDWEGTEKRINGMIEKNIGQIFAKTDYDGIFAWKEMLENLMLPYYGDGKVDELIWKRLENDILASIAFTGNRDNPIANHAFETIKQRMPHFLGRAEKLVDDFFRQGPEQGMGPKKEQEAQFCSILGVEVGASWGSIKKAYRKVAMVNHPDRNRADGAEEKFKKAAEAYEELGRIYLAEGRRTYS